MSEQTRIKPLEQAYYNECGTEKTVDDRPNYKHWLEKRVTKLEEDNERLKRRVEWLEKHLREYADTSNVADQPSGEASDG